MAESKIPKVIPTIRLTIDEQEYVLDRDANVVTCPECAGPVVFDSELWHCDNPDPDKPGRYGEGHGAWDPENVAREPVVDFVKMARAKGTT